MSRQRLIEEILQEGKYRRGVTHAIGPGALAGTIAGRAVGSSIGHSMGDGNDATVNLATDMGGHVGHVAGGFGSANSSVGASLRQMEKAKGNHHGG